MAELTIAISVYNVDKYLDVCLDSIINQSFKDIEILCVEDCSTDNSLAILEQYAKLDNRVRIIRNKKNSGFGYTHNIAIENCCSEYIMFVDSDDFLSPFMAETLLKNIKKYQSDFVYGNCYQFDDKVMSCQEWRLMPDKTFKQIVGGEVFNAQTTPALLPFNMFVMTWSKMFKTSFIKNIRFSDLPINGDEPFFFECFLRAQKISYELIPLYYYRVNRAGSLMHSNEKYLLDFEVQNQIRQMFEKYGAFEKYKEYILIYRIFHLIHKSINYRGKIKKQMFEMLKKDFSSIDLKQYDLNILRNNQWFLEMQKILNMSFEDFDILSKGGQA